MHEFGLTGTGPAPALSGTGQLFLSGGGLYFKGSGSTITEVAAT